MDPFDDTSPADFVRTCVPLAAYKDLVPIGEGVSGPVYRAHSIQTGTLVALKTLTSAGHTCQDDEYPPLPAKGEVHILRKLSHRNVIELLDVAENDHSGDDAAASASPEPGTMYAVFPYCTTDLASLLDDDVVFSLCEVQHLFRQLLTGLAYIHDNGVMHRDLKPDNLLLTSCTLKIADFGSSRLFGPASSPALTPVTTLWYRAPELLSLSYASDAQPVDTWAAGCILAELLLSEPLFQGEDEAEMWGLIAACVGPGEQRTEAKGEARIENRFARDGQGAVRMLRGFLCWDEGERWSARRGLEVGVEVWGESWGAEGEAGVREVVERVERERERGWDGEGGPRVEPGLETDGVEGSKEACGGGCRYGRRRRGGQGKQAVEV